jgi:hypothetical protein
VKSIGPEDLVAYSKGEVVRQCWRRDR